jgi:Putative transposase
MLPNCYRIVLFRRNIGLLVRFRLQRNGVRFSSNTIRLPRWLPGWRGGAGIQKSRKSEKERAHTGRPFAKASLHRLLTNATYAGMVEHRGATYVGEHACIIELPLWQRLHPHIHCVVPGGGMSSDRSRWIGSGDHFLLPIKVLSRVFRGKFLAFLRKAFRQGKLQFHGALAELATRRGFGCLLRKAYGCEWVVYTKSPFGGPEHVIRYLARYTHRVAISNHRIVSIADGQVTFLWKDYGMGTSKRR